MISLTSGNNRPKEERTMNSDSPEILIVSGLPRSGTSLCMRMLEAGGVPVLVDNLRESDDDNPNGYYEFEPVKQTRLDPSWVRDAGGKAVKMVYRLLYDLPPQFCYRVLFMRRNILEILASQRKMLERNGLPTDTVQDDEMQQLFESELAESRRWMRQQSHLEVIEINYNELIADPHSVVQSIEGFLEQPFDVSAMEAVINPELYRNRRCSTPEDQPSTQV